jgi:ATP-dependent exoDNAse (exonuclease V) alpha subunit
LHGQAGTGKSFLISALRGLFGSSCMLLAPTGVAAFNISGNTIHAALHIQVSWSDDLTGESLEALQLELRNVQLIIIDEMSMISQFLLHMIDRRLRQAFPNRSDTAFGGRSILLIGDFCQLKPVAATALHTNQKNTSKSANKSGKTLYLQFIDVFFLDTQVRQSTDSQFGEMLQRVRTEGDSEDDWKLLMSRHCVTPSLPNQCCS